ncbi:MAG: c-type cytochrome biogenesis protein CcmI [Hyphomicrobiaceae bacterium]
MIFWLICALLTVVAIVVSLRPVMAAAQPDDAADDSDLRVYKEQLAEVERDIGRGLLTAEEGESARIEISRRILALNPESGADTSAATRPSSLVFTVTSVLIVASTLGLYLGIGSPGYQGQPFAERASRSPSTAPIQELVARVEARLREVPNDGQGWDVLAPVYLKQGRNHDAARAYGRAIALLGENRARLRGLAEAHLAAANGMVVQPARDAFRKLLAKQPKLIAPRFWLAVGLEQDGKRDAATAAYQAILKDGTVDGKNKLPPTIRNLIKQRLAAVTGKATAPSALPEAGKVPSPPPGMAAAMPAKERAAMIEQMVAGLDQRLKENGGSVQEWQRLIRAYWVLGRREQSAGALARAKKQYAGDGAAGKKLDAFARELGMSPG